jgi:predicted transcriptional regulator
MTSAEFIEAGKRIFGKSGWRGQLAEALRIDRATVWRYANGIRPVPESISLALEALANRERVRDL